MQSLFLSFCICLIIYHSLLCCYWAPTSLINLYSFSYNQAEHEPIECVHTFIVRTQSLCYKNREYKKIKAGLFLKPSIQVKHSLFMQNNDYKNCEAGCHCTLKMI